MTGWTNIRAYRPSLVERLRHMLARKREKQDQLSAAHLARCRVERRTFEDARRGLFPG